MKILIIEDKKNHLMTAEMFAKESGHEVTIVDNYDDAEEALCGSRDRGFDRKEVQQYDVVLTDLFLPASKEGQADKSDKGEMPYGIVFVLSAMRSGVKKIALLTDGNHHAHPFIWAIDPLCKGIFRAGNIKVLFYADGLFYSSSSYAETIRRVPEGDPRIGCKAWQVLFDTLLKEE